jgi:G:T-mismatch repair DNA endonuclease (very short patch repair protein)
LVFRIYSHCTKGEVTPQLTPQEFWIPKIERNMARDIEVTNKLESEGWTVIRFWGNEIKKETEKCADIIEKAVKQK